jgi:hypothetical protein
MDTACVAKDDGDAYKCRRFAGHTSPSGKEAIYIYISRVFI